jgi:hypothetical protein
MPVSLLRCKLIQISVVGKFIRTPINALKNARRECKPEGLASECGCYLLLFHLDLQLLDLDGEVLGDLLDLALDVEVEPTPFAPENQSSIPEKKKEWELGGRQVSELIGSNVVMGFRDGNHKE